MNINLDLYNIVNLPNGNILLKLKKDIDYTSYKLVLTDISFYKACTKNIGKINIYEPTNLTHQLLKIIVDEAEKIKSQDDYFDKIKWIQENVLITEPNKINEEYINKFKSYIQNYTNDIKKKLEHYLKDRKTKIKKQTWIYLFVKIIAQMSEHYIERFFEEFFLLKLINQYYPKIKFDYEQIYMIETYNDIDMCKENGGRYYSLVQLLIKGDKNTFNGKEIKFFPSSYEKQQMNTSEEIFSHIKYNLYDDGVNWKDYEITNIDY
jgi:hypothetical protein